VQREQRSTSAVLDRMDRDSIYLKFHPDTVAGASASAAKRRRWPAFVRTRRHDERRHVADPSRVTTAWS
jgi:hypothetical protein